MVGERRFGPLAIALLAALGVLVLRLFQLQVLQHDTWAAEAASLAKSSQLLLSRRGRLLDRHGRVLVADEPTWRVELVYRDFRRGHPLGLVAHARSSLEVRPVALAEALAHLEPWAREIVSLSPAALDRFAKGGALATATCAVPALGDGADEARSSRASDLRFYAAALLRADEGERRRIRQAEKLEPRSEDSYAKIVASARGASEAAVQGDLAAELVQEPDRLARLAGMLAAGDRAGAKSEGTVGSLLERLEVARARSEEAAADELFEAATGFPPGRIGSASLARVFDLAWIARALRWDPARLQGWARGRRAAFEGDLVEISVPRILARAGLEEDEAVAERILDGLAALYARGEVPKTWRDLDEVCVVSDLTAIFDLPRRARWAGEDAPAIPLADHDVRALDEELQDPWLTLGTVAEMSGATLAGSVPTQDAREWAEKWKSIARNDRRLEGDEAQAALRALLAGLEARLASAADAGFEACLAAAASGDALPAALPIDRDALETAQQKERFLLRDLASRPVVLSSEAEYPLVHLLERDAALYRGFAAARATRRAIQVCAAPQMPIGMPPGTTGDRPLPVARALLGAVRGPTLRDVVQSEALAAAGDEEGLTGPGAGRTAMPATDRRGSFGLEAYFDMELRGRNGWHETSGLEGERDGEILEAAVHGEDVVLTLDCELQLAAQETLAHPASTSDPTTDAVWLQNPVGAIAVITLDGEVLVAASEPTQDGLPAAPGRDSERSHARERTLTRPTFNPPGSVFKPFVAAYALDRIGLDPAERFACVLLDDGGHGYEDRHGKMHCRAGGHTSSNLVQALEGSCNAAFAQIGERFTPAQLLEMTEIFGFNRPTGIRHLSGEGRARRTGLIENSVLPYAKTLPKKLGEPVSRMRFANGLSLVEATPMQVARALAGLVTGRLPELRIARTLGGRPVEKASSELPISRSARETVCAALEGVVSDPLGTAYGKGLDRGSLGFAFACKTGSADTWDLAPESGGPREASRGQKKMRKQTWVAGWFPVEAPKAVVVVMLHDTVETSSHTAVYVVAQFLRSPAVQRFVAGTPAAVIPVSGAQAPGAPTTVTPAPATAMPATAAPEAPRAAGVEIPGGGEAPR